MRRRFSFQHLGRTSQDIFHTWKSWHNSSDKFLNHKAHELLLLLEHAVNGISNIPLLDMFKEKKKILPEEAEVIKALEILEKTGDIKKAHKSFMHLVMSVNVHHRKRLVGSIKMDISKELIKIAKLLCAGEKYTIKVYTETIPGSAFEEGKEITETDSKTKFEHVDSFGDLYELVEWLKKQTGLRLEGYGERYRTIDAEKDMWSGDETTRWYFIKGMDRKEEKLVEKCVKERKNLIPDPDDFDNDVEWKEALKELLK